MDNSFKFAIILNKKLEPGVAMNAAAHLALSLGAQASPEQKSAMHFLDYQSADDVIYPSISGLSLIILRGKDAEIRKIVTAAREQNMLYATFLETMTGDTYKEQLERTSKTSASDIMHYGVGVFGLAEDINPLTRRCSLWK